MLAAGVDPTAAGIISAAATLWYSLTIHNYADTQTSSLFLPPRTGNGFDLDIFTYTDNSVLFVLFFTYMLVMCALAMCCASLIGTVRVANMVGFLLFCIGLSVLVPMVMEEETAYSMVLIN